MPEPAQLRTMPNSTEAVCIAAISGRTVLWIKSWSPENTSGGRPVMLGGQELPSQVGTVLLEPAHVLCVGPSEWLLVSAEEQTGSLRRRIEPDLSRQGLTLVNLTGGLAAFVAQGPSVRELLSKGCGLDLHPRSFIAGTCARTRLAQVPVIIECLDASPRYEFYVARSYIEYLHSWLIDACAEFGDVSR